ncbi:MAG TPA: 5'/3'-nucleotidase SurE [Acidimicrobiales bacterium]|jgi:5'-nucleotidase|nr:5'/3'-nucleotidase SurE [Acidimicrobiales bacterium]
MKSTPVRLTHLGRATFSLLALAGPSLLLTLGAQPADARSAPTLSILVTNDDGVTAPGIDAAVQALRGLPHTKVIVVAPLTNQSGTGSKTTPGMLTATAAQTASGYPAMAVAGYPADTIHWAIAQHGIAHRPNLVVSGINFGQNIGPLADVSGTVGAARAAASLGIPAIATSQGIDNGAQPNFAQSAAQLVRWVQSHRAALLKGTFKARQSVQMNVPTCPGPVRGPIQAPLAASVTGINILQVNCSSTVKKFPNDVQAFLNGYAVISPLGKAAS